MKRRFAIVTALVAAAIIGLANPANAGLGDWIRKLFIICILPCD